jgi:hypothetical protein
MYYVFTVYVLGPSKLIWIFCDCKGGKPLVEHPPLQKWPLKSVNKKVGGGYAISM